MKTTFLHPFGCYEIRNTVNGKRYIGSGDFKNRKRHHFASLRRGTHHSVVLQRAWVKYGAEAFSFRVLVYCDHQDCVMYEQRLMNTLNPEYNVARDARAPMFGRKHTPEARAQIGRGGRGRHPTEETRQRLCAAQRGKFISEETRKRISESKKGKSIRRTEEHNRKIGDAQRGKLRLACRGKKRTAATRANMRAAWQRRKQGIAA